MLIPGQTEAPDTTPGTLLGFPLCTDVTQLDANIAILGIPYIRVNARALSGAQDI